MLYFHIIGLIYSRFRSLRTPANQLVINLAVSDFLVLFVGPAFVYNSLHEGPAVSEFGKFCINLKFILL